MTPGARLQAAIDILSSIDRTGQPADRVFDGWSRASRYAGSKDRAAIGELVFTVLRHKGELIHALKSSESRLLALGAVTLINGEGVAGVMALADGTRHAPAPLAPEETETLRSASLPDEQAPLPARLNYPEWLHQEFVAAFGDNLESEMTALMERAPTDLRVNVLRSGRDKAQARLLEEGVETEPTPHAPYGLRMKGKANLPALQSYRDGLFELQDEGSQIACLLAEAKPGEQIVDLCAGGGGKSLGLAAMMKNRGQIYACDTDPRRLANLMPRAQRAGIRNIQTRSLKPGASDAETAPIDSDLGDLETRMDCVFVDAPCSGSGAWRRNPGARWTLTPQMLDTYKSLQVEVLARGARLVRPGGRLIYVTCSVLPGENEAQVEAFLAAHPDFVPIAPSAISQENIPVLQQKGITRTASIRLSPATTGTDAFFIALLERSRA